MKHMTCPTLRHFRPFTTTIVSTSRCSHALRHNHDETSDMLIPVQYTQQAICAFDMFLLRGVSIALLIWRDSRQEFKREVMLFDHQKAGQRGLTIKYLVEELLFYKYTQSMTSHVHETC